MKLTETKPSIHSLGGKARWKGISKKKRSEIMKAVRQAGLLKKKKVL